MNKKLLSILFIIVVLASFSAIGCKNNNTNPGTTVTGTDIGEKYPGNWRATITVHYDIPSDAPQSLRSFIEELQVGIKEGANVGYQLTINSDGSMKIALTIDGKTGETIEPKNNITKESEGVYYVKKEFGKGVYTIEKYTFTSTDAGTLESYIEYTENGKTYIVYTYKDIQLTRVLTK